MTRRCQVQQGEPPGRAAGSRARPGVDQTKNGGWDDSLRHGEVARARLPADGVVPDFVYVDSGDESSVDSNGSSVDKKGSAQ